MANCPKCGRTVTADEIGLNRKIVHREATEFRCLACLAEYFQTTEDALRETIERYRAAGCTLFPRRKS